MRFTCGFVQPTVCFHDSFAQMPPGVRFHPSDYITQDKGVPIADIVRGISRGIAIEYTDVEILPVLPETMTIQERCPFSHTISDPQESWQVSSFYDITPHAADP